jgi:hypothetical protein
MRVKGYVTERLSTVADAAEDQPAFDVELLAGWDSRLLERLSMERVLLQYAIADATCSLQSFRAATKMKGQAP